MIFLAEPYFTKCNILLDQHLCWTSNNILINQSDFEGQVYSLDLQPGLGAPTSVN